MLPRWSWTLTWRSKGGTDKALRGTAGTLSEMAEEVTKTTRDLIAAGCNGIGFTFRAIPQGKPDFA